MNMWSRAVKGGTCTRAPEMGTEILLSCWLKTTLHMYRVELHKTGRRTAPGERTVTGSYKSRTIYRAHSGLGIIWVPTRIYLLLHQNPQKQALKRSDQSTGNLIVYQNKGLYFKKEYKKFNTQQCKIHYFQYLIKNY